MQLAVVERLAATAKWALVATVPPVLLSALLDLPDSLGRLTLLALQGFVLLYFNGRVAAAQRRRAPPGPVGPGSWLDPRFNQDLLAVGVSTVIALAGYLLLLRALLSLQ
jgi:hypothetical protein